MNLLDIKTIVFDLGGVLFTSGTTLAIKKISTNYGINYRKVGEIFLDKTHKLGYKLRSGMISMEEFLDKVIKKLNLEEEDKEHIQNIWFNSYIPHFGMFDLLKKLKINYRLVIFSGNVKARIDFLNNRYDFLKYFDDYVFSYIYHHNKAEIEFYNELLNHLKCKPNQSLLIDDSSKTVKIARSFGLNANIFYYPEKLIKDLKNFNIKIN